MPVVDLSTDVDPGSSPRPLFLGPIDRSGSSTFGHSSHAIGNCHMLMVLDNCEHVLMRAPSWSLNCCARVTFYTSRSRSATGEVTQVPSLFPANEDPVVH